jgi:hypothetical protein
MGNPMATQRSQPARVTILLACGLILLGWLSIDAARAQGLVQGMQQGAAAGNKAAGPVGGVLGGAIGGVVGVFTGVLGVNNNQGQQGQPAAAESGSKPSDRPADSKSKKAAKTVAKDSKTDSKIDSKTDAKGEGKPVKTATVLTQPGQPQLTAEQIVANSDAYVDRVKKELNLTAEQEKHWAGFSRAMHHLGHSGAERLNLRIARAKRDPPDDVIEQMRNEAQFLNDRAVDQRNVADAAEPLFAVLDEKQKTIFIEEMVRLSHERGLD